MSDYQQLKTANVVIDWVPEECLVDVRNSFGIPPKFPTAIAAWNNSTALNHPNEQPPVNNIVPVFFSYNGPDGHVALWYKGTIYSSSTKGLQKFTSIQALINWMGEGFKYLGWSEELNGERIVQPIATPAPAASGSTINLPANSGAWHLYKPGGPYNPANVADVVAVVHPALYAPGGLTYPIEANLGNGVYRVKSPSHGVVDLWTKGSSVVIK